MQICTASRALQYTILIHCPRCVLPIKMSPNIICHEAYAFPSCRSKNCKHNGKIKNYAPNGPEGQLSTGRLRDVQCRPPLLVSRVRDLGILEQGKYEEERKKKSQRGRREAGIIYYLVGGLCACHSCPRHPRLSWCLLVPCGGNCGLISFVWRVSSLRC